MLLNRSKPSCIQRYRKLLSDHMSVAGVTVSLPEVLKLTVIHGEDWNLIANKLNSYPEVNDFFTNSIMLLSGCS